MQVRLFQDNESDAKVWDSYVAQNSHATSDHLWGWRNVLSRAFGFREQYYLGAIEDNALVGILPLYRVPLGWGKTALTSIPYGNYGGICADSKEATSALYAKAQEIMENTRGQYLELKHRKSIETVSLQEPRHSHSRFFLPLTDGTDSLFRHIGQNNRSKVRRASKWGLTTFFSRDVDRFYPIYSHTAHRQGTPCFPKRYFQEILNNFGDQSQIFFAAMGELPVACYLMLYFKEHMVCQFSSSYSHSYKYYPNEFIFWRAIEEGCKMGMRELDFCRSRVSSGTADFKRKLHYHEEQLDYQYFLPDGRILEPRSPANSKYRLAIAAWQRMPHTFVNFLGPRLVRYFA
ncbi:MAG: peptidoglycan bridge formation glycyltransferase FemA/FemB family protein [Candidatus Omnitrophota bacterium]|nr:peptidoglycan bridge formation glycyltransferase FemA/FemB family protein [Candidatus Omnitrophota bacterium]